MINEYLYASSIRDMERNTNTPGIKILITGGTSGLGLELAKFYLKEGHKVFATGRQNVHIPVSAMNYKFVPVEFSNLEQVEAIIRKLLKSVNRFDIIINNAGVLSPPEYLATVDGFEYTWQVNFLSHIIIDEIILRNTMNQEGETIVSITSPVYRYSGTGKIAPSGKPDYNPIKAYSFSKLALVLLGEHLSEKYKSRHIRCFSFDPGTFSSGIYRMQEKWFQNMYRIASPFMRNPEKVAGILTEIIKEEEIRNGAIYTKRDKYRYLQGIDEEEKSVFWKKCYDLIDPFI
jgi:NAD(P)-dependent dehydrogenase (short-subunit alcohol dehydrogenase family)